MPMNDRGSISILLRCGAALLGAALVLVAPAVADEPSDDPAHAHDPTDIWAIGRGGQLYDNWMAVTLSTLPAKTHPAYPATGKKKGAATWRCKECHGWDTLGRDGAYATGSHKTGIKGLRRVIGMEPDKIVPLFMDPPHAYTKFKISHAAQEMLSYFLSKGQIDMERVIDRDTNKAQGEVKKGARLFQHVCATCHGYDGKEINFTSAKFPSYVGTVCVKNPWEALHKIRYGQPGVGMVALTNLPLDDIADILAYCQTLPVK